MNGYDIGSHRTFYGTFREYALAQPDREWLLYERPDERVDRWSYGEFLAAVHRAAQFLRERGVAPGDRVILHHGNHPAHPLLMLAASAVGAVLVPTNPASTAPELEYVVRHSGATLVFAEPAALETAREASAACEAAVVLVEGDPAGLMESLPALPGTPPERADRPERELQILYTSGTTSGPKGVVMTNAAMIYAAEVTRAATGATPADRHLVTLPLFHGAAQFHGLWVSLIAGASAVIVPRFSASRFWEQATRHGATLVALFGAPLRMLLNQPARDYDRAHHVRNITFAQNLTPEQYAEWDRRFGAPLQQLWGMTETVTVPILSPLTGPRNLLAMGRAVLGYELRIVDPDGDDVPTGEVGQLIVRGLPGRTLMSGYYRDEAATARVLRPVGDGSAWLLTGDMVYADADGYIYFADRGGDMIKRAGERISSAEIETVLRRCPGVADATVVTIPDPFRDETIIGLVIPAPDSAVTDADVIAFCRANLSSFKVPEQVLFTRHFARTSVGKIQKHLMRQRLLDLGLDRWPRRAADIADSPDMMETTHD